LSREADMPDATAGGPFPPQQSTFQRFHVSTLPRFRRPRGKDTSRQTETGKVLGAFARCGIRAPIKISVLFPKGLASTRQRQPRETWLHGLGPWLRTSKTGDRAGMLSREITYLHTYIHGVACRYSPAHYVTLTLKLGWPMLGCRQRATKGRDTSSRSAYGILAS
jgi:hypothetical protein